MFWKYHGQGAKYNTFTENPVTLKIEPSPKVDMSGILSIVTIYPNLKAIGELFLEISWTQLVISSQVLVLMLVNIYD